MTARVAEGQGPGRRSWSRAFAQHVDAEPQRRARQLADLDADIRRRIVLQRLADAKREAMARAEKREIRRWSLFGW